jgi:WhiB family redox-sensing transcriptional regulator
MSEWKQRALCARPELAPLRDLFFPGPKDTETAATAKQICAACPVRQACLDAAIAEEGGASHSYRFGIRGGLGPRGRRYRYEQARKNQRKAAA